MVAGDHLDLPSAVAQGCQHRRSIRLDGIADTRQHAVEDAAQVARQLSEEQLNGENKRFEAGLSTNFEVLRFQRDSRGRVIALVANGTRAEKVRVP